MNSPVPQHETYKIAIVEREIDVGHERRHGLEALEERRQLFRIGGLGRDFDHLLDRPLAVDPFEPFLLCSRYHSQIDEERSFSDITTPAKP